MKYKDLRDFIQQLESLGELKKLSQSVSPHLEMTAIGDKLLRSAGPAVLCTNPQGYKIPCLINLFGTTRRVALGMGADDVSQLRERRREVQFSNQEYSDGSSPRSSHLDSLRRMAASMSCPSPR